MSESKKICGTCNQLILKPNVSSGGGDAPKKGYCYGVPPSPGRIFPVLYVTDRACGMWQAKPDKPTEK